jgi:N-acyl-D-aspartate/D-glutamate deacylase
MVDLLIRDGFVVDGTGGPGSVADVAIEDGRVVAVEPSLGVRSSRTVDATGLVVAPGFIDIHTHLDAQLFWDPLVSPSSNHGFTTVIGGNCGFTFAPMGESQDDYLPRLMSVVEGIPLEAITSSVPFSWRTFDGYLSRLDGQVGVNVGFLVGHSALRRAVMGTRAVECEATLEEITAMASLLAESIRAGGMGFSSSWTTVHIDHEGRPAPSRAATMEELVALAAVAGKHPGTTLEFAPGIRFGDRETQAMIEMSRAAKRTVNWNVLQVRTPDRDDLDRQLRPSGEAASSGARIVALTFPDSTVSWHSMHSGMLYDNLPGWSQLMHAPMALRVQELRDPEIRTRLREGAAKADAPFFRLLASWARQRVFATYSHENEGLAGRLIGDIAQERGIDPFDTFLNIALADDLRTYVELPCDDDLDQLWQMRAELWRDSRTLIGGSDAGAHLDTLASQRYPTAMLSKAVRQRGLLSLEEAIAMVTDAPARFYGLRDRGRVAPGFWADIVLFDRDRIGHKPMSARHDLPGGAMRIYVEPEGIEAVFVNGIEILSADQPTGDLPGTVIRSRDLDTVTIA